MIKMHSDSFSPHRCGGRAEEFDYLPLYFTTQRLGSLLIEIPDDTVINKDVGGLSVLDGTIRALAALNLGAQ